VVAECALVGPITRSFAPSLFQIVSIKGDAFSSVELGYRRVDPGLEFFDRRFEQNELSHRFLDCGINRGKLACLHARSQAGFQCGIQGYRDRYSFTYIMTAWLVRMVPSVPTPYHRRAFP